MSRIGATSLAVACACSALITLVSEAPAQPKSSGSCIKFMSPVAGDIITAQSCTVSVAACPVVRAITFKASYLLGDGQARETISLGRLTRPPFKIVWDLRKVPNQLTTGASVIADAEYIGGKQTSHELEGVFLGHIPVTRGRAKVSKLGRLGREESRDGVNLTGPDTSVSARMRVYWDRQNLVFSIIVKDKRFGAAVSEPVQRNSGCEILLDGARRLHPYPTDSVVALRIPLLGEVLRRRYDPVFTAEGGYSLGVRGEAYPHHYSVSTAEGKGWRVVCTVPPDLLGPRLPRSVRCNAIARVAHEDGQVSVLTWQGDTRQGIYSPYTWGTLILRDKPLVQKPGVLFVIGFMFGLLCVLAAFPIVGRMNKVSGMVLAFESPEGEKKIADMLRAFIDSRVPDKAASLEDVANEFSLEPRHVDRLLRKYTERAFHPYLAGLRIEVAKERLRSSNASESTVAELCGFRNVEEMERMFLKYSKMTPYKFRLENQVT